MIEHKKLPSEWQDPIGDVQDRRESERLPSEMTSVWRIVSESLDEPAWATVRDISLTGIGLIVKQSLKPGVVLIINLQNQHRQLARPLSVRVMHSTSRSDGTYLVGCEFVRKLSGQEIQVLRGDE